MKENEHEADDDAGGRVGDVGGFVSTKIVPLQQARMASLQGKTLTVLKREKPSFAAMTAGKAAFGLIGATAMVVMANSIVKENNIEDPAGYIAEELAGDLANAHGQSEPQMLAEGFCARIPEKSDNAPGYDELMADQATRLKQELTAGADHCIAEFRSKVLKSSGMNAGSAARVP